MKLLNCLYLALLLLTSSSLFAQCANFTGNFSYTLDSNTTSVVYFNGNATGGTAPYTYSWTVDNSMMTGQSPLYQYSGNGWSSVCMTVVDANGCTFTYCDSVQYGATTNPCASLMGNFTYMLDSNNSSVVYFDGNAMGGTAPYTYSWTVDSGTMTGQYPLYQYSGNGWSSVCMTVVDANGCTFTYCDSVQFGATTNPCASLMGNFTYMLDSNNSSVVYFDGNAMGGTAPYTYSWTVDNGTMTGQYPLYQYSGNGWSSVCMTVVDANGCTFTYCDSVQFGAATNPCANFSVSMNIYQDSTSAFNLYVQPTVTGGSPNTNLNSLVTTWTFGDGTMDSTLTPSHVYNQFGAYVLCLTVYDMATGCSATVCDSIALDSNGVFSRSAFVLNALNPIIQNTVTSSTAVEAGQADQLKLYPNPVAEVLNLELTTANAAERQVQIMDMNGRLVQQVVFQAQEGVSTEAVFVGDLPQGFYTVTVLSDTERKTVKFIKL